MQEKHFLFDYTQNHYESIAKWTLSALVIRKIIDQHCRP